MEIQQNEWNENVNSTPLFENNPLHTAKCWRCHEGADKGEIIRLCLCKDIQFVHVDCLEKSVNIRSIYHCRICDVSLPLERRNKPLVEWYTNRTALLIMLKGSCGPICKILIFILFKFSLAILTGFLIVSLDVSKIGQFIVLSMIVLVLLIMLICPIVREERMIIAWITRVREYCQKWYQSNQEMKLSRWMYQRMVEEIV